MFRFKQFIVHDDRCAMKVGTDAVLLGAWCPCEEVRSQKSEVRILDIGAGSGVIALMLAQRCPNALIDAIDIDPDAVAQAQFNFDQSPWSNRLRAQCISLQKYQLSIINYQFDLIVSNPPFFVDSLKNPDPQRLTARHTDSLSYSDLVRCAAELLSDTGTLALILPAEAEALILSEAAKVGLTPTHLTHVYSKPGKPLKRILVAFKKGPSYPCEVTDFYIESETAPRSPEYARLTEEFYL